MMHILRIAMLNARPNLGLNQMGKSEELKEEVQAVCSFLKQVGRTLIHESKESLIDYLSFLMNFLTYNH